MTYVTPFETKNLLKESIYANLKKKNRKLKVQTSEKK